MTIIATCGHEVKHGISATIVEGPDYVFGTYCLGCVIGYHEVGVLESGELKQLVEAISPDTREFIQLSVDQAVELDQLKYRLSEAERVLQMVEDNTKMPHKHEDPQLRLYCLSERAHEYFEKWEDKDGDV